MQDDQGPGDDALLRILLEGLPLPSPRAELSGPGQRRLEDLGATTLLAHVKRAGVGPIAGGAALLPDPAALDPVLVELGVLDPGVAAFALVSTSLGAATALDASGRIIGIDPMSSTVTLVPSVGPPPTAIGLQISAIQEVLAVLGELDDPDQPIDLNGDRLDRVLPSLLGPIAPGEVYAMTLGYDEPRAFDAATWTKSPLAAALLDRHGAEPFEVVDLGA